ncbi:MAG: MarR family transcriptional regulator [Frankiales bacterium]|jgi:DNA-binding MarR family transcriptional regulator|nr:MarR family transcriptional regulator [Frankiales bacterium]
MPSPTSAGVSVDSVTRAVTGIRNLILAGEELRSAMAAHFGITESETEVLSYLSIEDGLTAGELAERLRLTPSTITAVLDRMDRAGLADRSPHPTDRRRIVITLTPRGSEALAYAQGWLLRALAKLDPAAMDQIGPALHQIGLALRVQTALIRNPDADPDDPGLVDPALLGERLSQR